VAKLMTLTVEQNQWQDQVTSESSTHASPLPPERTSQKGETDGLVGPLCSRNAHDKAVVVRRAQ
jgi:hypothetical protein